MKDEDLIILVGYRCGSVPIIYMSDASFLIKMVSKFVFLTVHFRTPSRPTSFLHYSNFFFFFFL